MGVYKCPWGLYLVNPHGDLVNPHGHFSKSPGHLVSTHGHGHFFKNTLHKKGLKDHEEDLLVTVLRGNYKLKGNCGQKNCLPFYCMFCVSTLLKTNIRTVGRSFREKIAVSISCTSCWAGLTCDVI